MSNSKPNNIENSKINNKNKNEDKEYKKNIKRRLSKLSEFPCDQCGYKTPSKTLLERYTESVHKV